MEGHFPKKAGAEHFPFIWKGLFDSKVYSALVAIKDVAIVGSQLCRAVKFSSICSKENWYGKPVNLVVPKGVRKNEFFVDEWLVCLIHTMCEVVLWMDHTLKTLMIFLDYLISNSLYICDLKTSYLRVNIVIIANYLTQIVWLNSRKGRCRSKKFLCVQSKGCT